MKKYESCLFVTSVTVTTLAVLIYAVFSVNKLNEASSNPAVSISQESLQQFPPFDIYICPNSQCQVSKNYFTHINCSTSKSPNVDQETDCGNKFSTANDTLFTLPLFNGGFILECFLWPLASENLMPFQNDFSVVHIASLKFTHPTSNSNNQKCQDGNFLFPVARGVRSLKIEDFRDMSEVDLSGKRKFNLRATAQIREDLSGNREVKYRIFPTMISIDDNLRSEMSFISPIGLDFDPLVVKEEKTYDLIDFFSGLFAFVSLGYSFVVYVFPTTMPSARYFILNEKEMIRRAADTSTSIQMR